MPPTYFDSSVIENLLIARDTYAQQVQSSVLYQLCVCTLHGMCISPGFLFIQQDTSLLIKLRKHRAGKLAIHGVSFMHADGRCIVVQTITPTPTISW